jgi:hypothetical protein
VQVDVVLVVDSSLWHPARRQRRRIGPGNTGPQHRPAEGAGAQRRCHIQQARAAVAADDTDQILSAVNFAAGSDTAHPSFYSE